jgi:5-methylcytosine-specific restriction protein A
MAASKRAFRTQDSLDAEAISRDAVAPFLISRGFEVEVDHRAKTGTAVSQDVTAIDPNGKRIKMRVRLCWRWDREHKSNNCSAAQLRARLINNDWDITLDTIVSHAKEKGITHMMLMQRSGKEIVYAALIPIAKLKAIWVKQRDVSAKLIKEGKMGRTRKNHAMNGDSPTVWLMDNRKPEAHAVPDALWNWPGVEDLVNLPITKATNDLPVDDTFDDLPGVDYSDLGSDGAKRVTVVRSHVQRDRRVRQAVIERAKEGCERETCEDVRSYPGFLDVHHILGADTSDRVWNCVALCPNCHREAHYAPDHQRINDELLKFALQFKTKKGTKGDYRGD